MLRLIYTVVLALAAPFLLWGLFRNKPGKPNVGPRWKEHFGYTPKLSKSGSDVIWFHAVSVGEVLAVTPLIRQYAKLHPQNTIVITTTTPTGAEQAEKLSDIAEHRYMPIDFGFAVKGFLKSIKPKQLIIMETELWPNTLNCVASAGIPISVINARLSERSYLRYKKFQPIFNLLAPHLSSISCQYEDDAKRFIKLGISESKVHTTGSIKYDISVSQQTLDEGQALRRQLGADRPVWIAASTHSGEDEQFLSAHNALLKQFPSLLLILVPRHPERFTTVQNLCESRGFNVKRRSGDTTTLDMGTSVFLGDTMGEMMVYLSASDICFVGGSLIGDKVGGHNLLEPAALELPILTGPSYYNFKDITQKLTANDAALICQNDQQIEKAVANLLNEPETAEIMGKNARRVVEQNQGSLERTLNALVF